MVLNYIGTFNITTFLGIFSEKRGNFDLSRRNWNMQALRKEENLVFYRTINGVSTRTEVTRDEMDSLINKEIMAREFLVKVIKEKFERTVIMMAMFVWLKKKFQKSLRKL